MRALASIVLLSSLLAAGAAFAQTAAPAAKAPAPATAAPKADASAKAAKSKECSAQADQKGLHGKARKTFRAACKKG